MFFLALFASENALANPQYLKFKIIENPASFDQIQDQLLELGFGDEAISAAWNLYDQMQDGEGIVIHYSRPFSSARGKKKAVFGFIAKFSQSHVGSNNYLRNITVVSGLNGQDSVDLEKSLTKIMRRLKIDQKVGEGTWRNFKVSSPLYNDIFSINGT